MGSRLKLHEELCEILGTRNVYYNPPASVKRTYPCIQYALEAPDQKRANNGIYQSINRYEVTVIEHDPESDTADNVQRHFPWASIDRRYKADNLNHTVLTIYY